MSRKRGSEHAKEKIAARLKARKGGWDEAPTAGQLTPMAAPTSFYGGAGQGPLGDPAARQRTRLYCGNLPRDDYFSEQDLVDHVNRAMYEAKAIPANAPAPCTGSNLNMSKGFAFLDFLDAKNCTIGLSFDGLTFKGSMLKFRRPKDYTPPGTSDAPRESRYIPGIVMTQVLDGPHKLFLGSLPTALTEDRVRELVETFGPLRAFNLVKDSSTGQSRGYAFFEYADHSHETAAIKGLSEVQFKDKKLQCQYASSESNKAELILDDIDFSKETHDHVKAVLDLSSPLSAALSAMKVNNEPTDTLVLINLFHPRHLTSLVDVEDAVADIRDECAKYGTIEDLIVPIPPAQPPLEPGRVYEHPPIEPYITGIGCAFIKYSSVEEAKNAQLNLAGRKFQGRTVVTSYQ